MNKIAIIGAGICGLAAAYDLAKVGNKVTIIEKSNRSGGLAGGFKKKEWDWSLEKFYHHWFRTDQDALNLIKELGLWKKVRFYRPKTVVYHQGGFFSFDSPLAALLFPGFSLLNKIRFGFLTLYLRYLADWKPLEKVTAHQWMSKYYGKNVYETLFEPLLVGKFNGFYQDVNMAWFWARFKVRTPKLGTYVGGFQAFLDDFERILKSHGVIFQYQTSIEKIVPALNHKISLWMNGKELIYDQVLATVPPQVFISTIPKMEKSYLDKLMSLKSIGAVVLILAIKYPLSKKKFYWFNLPKSGGFPFLALVEHTNFASADHFNGDHLIYCGDYLEASHEYFSLTKEELIDRFMPSLKKINPEFKKEWLLESWVFKTTYAQPIPLINHSRNIPEIRTPIPNLYFASMSQVYPWDRGTNFAVQLGRKAAEMMLGDTDLP